MNIKCPLYWHQGLFLQPQHLQYADAHHAWRASALIRASASGFWGMADLGLNEERLNSGIVEVERASVLFRDGTHAEVPDNAVLASRDIRAQWAADDKEMTVYVGIKQLRDTEANVTVVTDRDAASQVATRYASIADAPPMPDLHQGRDASAQVKTMYHVLRIFTDSELDEADEYETLPLTHLVRDGDTIRIDPAFAPPALTMAAVPQLVHQLREIREQVVGRAHQLEEYKTSSATTTGPGSGNSEFSPKAMRYRFALQVLGRYAPLISHYADAPQVHPHEVYGVLRQLVGELSVFASDMDILGTPPGEETGMSPYDHRRPGRIFREARLTIERLLNSITVGPEYIVELEHTAFGRFEREIPRQFLDRRASLYLALRTQYMSDAVLESFMSYVKIGAAHEVDLFARRALPGLSVEYLKVRPESLPQRPDSHYFRLDQNETQWEGVENTRTLAVLWDGAPDDLKIELIMVRG